MPQYPNKFATINKKEEYQRVAPRLIVVIVAKWNMASVDTDSVVGVSAP